MKETEKRACPFGRYPCLKMINRALAALVALILPLAVFAAFLKMSDQRFGFGGYRFYRITTGSMEPAYQKGDYVITRRTDAGKVEAGDVIAFVSRSGETGGQVIIHRVAYQNTAGEFVTKGDFNPAKDFTYVKNEDVLGVVTARLTFLRRIDRLFSHGWAFGIFMVFPILFIMAGETVMIIQEKRRKDAVFALMARYGFQPGDQKLFWLFETYGEDALREIAANIAFAKETKPDRP